MFKGNNNHDKVVTNVKDELLHVIDEISQNINSQNIDIERLRADIRNSSLTSTEEFFIKNSLKIGLGVGLVTAFIIPMGKILGFALTTIGIDASAYALKSNNSKDRESKEKRCFTLEEAKRGLLSKKEDFIRIIKESENSSIVANALKATLTEAELDDFYTIFYSSKAPFELLLFEYYKGDKEEIAKCAAYIRILEGKNPSRRKDYPEILSKFTALIKDANHYINEPLNKEMMDAKTKAIIENIRKPDNDESEKVDFSYVPPYPQMPISSAEYTPSIPEGYQVPFGLYDEDVRTGEARIITPNGEIYELPRFDEIPKKSNAPDNVIDFQEYVASHKK